MHQAALDVDEGGATAAGATGIGFYYMSSGFYRYVPELKFNRPFMVMIFEKRTKNLLFMGKIVNPNL